MAKQNNTLLMQAAKLYYMQQLTQAEIGRQLNTSRSTVSRLLQEARDKGIVKITIDYPWERDDELENALKCTFNLHDVRVVVGYDQPSDEVRQGKGLLAAEYIDQIVRDDMVLAMSYGRSLASMVQQVKPTREVNITVVQMIGALGSGNPLLDGPDQVRDLAEAYGGRYRYLHAPLLVEDRQTRDRFMREPAVQETLALAKRAEVAILGVGALESGSSGLIWTGYLSQKDVVWLQNKGGVGHMCAQYYDTNGQLLDVELNKRTVGIGLEALRSIETVIAVAGGQEKARAILGGLRGNYIDVLITDDQAAQEVLDLEAEISGTTSDGQTSQPNYRATVQSQP
jgi:DNA-binding transcriptional regulator LsrR (DeoR family)